MPSSGLLKQETFVSYSSGAGKFKTKARVDSVFGERLLPGSQTAIFLLCPHMAEGARELSGVSFIRARIPFLSDHP